LVSRSEILIRVELFQDGFVKEFVDLPVHLV